jgi:hypothetical protein
VSVPRVVCAATFETEKMNNRKKPKNKVLNCIIEYLLDYKKFDADSLSEKTTAKVR